MKTFTMLCGRIFAALAGVFITSAAYAVNAGHGNDNLTVWEVAGVVVCVLLTVAAAFVETDSW